MTTTRTPIRRFPLPAILTTIFLAAALLGPPPANASPFDNLLKKAKETVEEQVDKAVDEVAGDEPAPPTAEPGAPAAAPVGNMAAHNASVGGAIITLNQVPAERRPASRNGLGLMRVRYEPDWFTGDALLRATKHAVVCRQEWLRLGRWRLPGCIGAWHWGPKREPNHDYYPAFPDEAVRDRNADFAAREVQDEFRTAVLALADRLPPTFTHDVLWHGRYDHAAGELEIELRRFEPAQNATKNRLPPAVRHLDLYETPGRSHDDGRHGGAMLPTLDGITAVGFDRNLQATVRLKLAPAAAEQLYAGRSTAEGLGAATLKYRVIGTDGSAALAELEGVALLPPDPESAADASSEPFTTLPPEAFPKITAPQAKAPPPPKPAPAPQPKPQPPAEPGPADIDPLARAATGAPFGPDVAGIRLGMTPAQADALIRARKEPREVRAGNAPPPFTEALLYVLEPGDEIIALYLLDAGHGDRIALLERTVYFDPADPPPLVAMAASLEEKYGAPQYRYETPVNFNRMWLTDWRGRPFPESSGTTRACENALGASRSHDAWRRGDNPYTWQLPWSDRARGNPGRGYTVADLRRPVDANRCGPTVRASYADDGGQPIGASLRVQLFDAAWLVAANQAFDETAREAGVKDLDL